MKGRPVVGQHPVADGDDAAESVVVDDERKAVVAEIEVFQTAQAAEGEGVDATQSCVTQVESTQ